MEVGPAWVMCLFVVASSASFRGDILEQWIHPLTRDAFFKEFFEKTWAHFPHPESMIQISLEGLLARLLHGAWVRTAACVRFSCFCVEISSWVGL